jgi:hypothetical protein
MVENTDRNKQNTGCNGNLHYLPLANHLALLPAKKAPNAAERAGIACSAG